MEFHWSADNPLIHPAVRMSPPLPLRLCTWPNTMLIVCVSRVHPFSTCVLLALGRLWNAQCVLVAATHGPLPLHSTKDGGMSTIACARVACAVGWGRVVSWPPRCSIYGGAVVGMFLCQPNPRPPFSFAHPNPPPLSLLLSEGRPHEDQVQPGSVVDGPATWGPSRQIPVECGCASTVLGRPQGGRRLGGAPVPERPGAPAATARGGEEGHRG